MNMNQENKPQEVVGHYITDMIGLERYFCDALEQQVKSANVKKYTGASQIISQNHQIVHQHVEALKQHLSLVKEDESAMSAIKEAITSGLGLIKSTYEKLRADSVSKMLRDNYVVSNLCCVGYTMLHTTALACNDEATANLALRNLNDLTPIVMKYNEIIPQVVVEELAEQGKIRDSSIAVQAVKNSQDAWRTKVPA